MRVYRLVECSGYYEDYCEYRIGTYASKSKAQEVKKQHEKMARDAEEQAVLCAECLSDIDGGCQKLCLSYKEIKGEKNDCANYSTYWEPSTFRIDEEEVIE